jgi:hypothetical protein
VKIKPLSSDKHSSKTHVLDPTAEQGVEPQGEIIWEEEEIYGVMPSKITIPARTTHTHTYAVRAYIPMYVCNYLYIRMYVHMYMCVCVCICMYVVQPKSSRNLNAARKPLVVQLWASRYHELYPL